MRDFTGYRELIEADSTEEANRLIRDGYELLDFKIEKCVKVQRSILQTTESGDVFKPETHSSSTQFTYPQFEVLGVKYVLGKR